jgi:hypothetical protein
MEGKVVILAWLNNDFANRLTLRQATKELNREGGKQGFGQDMVDIAGTGIDLFASVGDHLHDSIGNGEVSLVVLMQAATDLAELETDNPADDILG